MKRIIVALILLLGAGLAAKADNDTYVDNTRHGRGNDALHADVDSCAQIFGMPQNGTPTSRPFRRCMLGHGWRYQFSTLSPRTRPSPAPADDDSWTFLGCTFNPASSSDC
jgi:hypothetical protein